MSILNLKDIEKKVRILAKKINAPESFMPTFGYSKDFALPHIEIDDFGYHYVIVEQGQELERKTTLDVENLLYWIFENITFSMASDYELNNRVEGQDPRIILFTQQQKLLSKIDSKFVDNFKKETDQILRIAPFAKPPKFD